MTSAVPPAETRYASAEVLRPPATVSALVALTTTVAVADLLP
jgi:hypothetical protein